MKYLQRSVKTRWNSEFQSATSYLELRQHVETASKRVGYERPEPLTEEEVHILQDYVVLLKPIDEMTNILSGETYATSMELIYKCFNILKHFVINIQLALCCQPFQQ